MQKSTRTVVGVIAVVVIALGSWYVIANRNSGSGYSSASRADSMMRMSNNSSSNTNNQTATATNTVTIQNFVFSPANIKVRAGTAVTWTNKDNVAHTVTETDGQSGPDSSAINPNGTYTFTFTKAGTYHYHCSIHTEMGGTVTVTS